MNYEPIPLGEQLAVAAHNQLARDRVTELNRFGLASVRNKVAAAREKVRLSMVPLPASRHGVE